MSSIKTGGVQMVPIDGGHRVWTKRFGSGSIPLLTLHGGPGGTHEYFECFEDFLPQHDIQIIYYDQLGSAYSDQPNDPSLWTLENFREEVEQVDAVVRREIKGGVEALVLSFQSKHIDEDEEVIKADLIVGAKQPAHEDPLGVVDAVADRHGGAAQCGTGGIVVVKGFHLVGVAHTVECELVGERSLARASGADESEGSVTRLAEDVVAVHAYGGVGGA